jgi:hypothetical protein
VYKKYDTLSNVSQATNKFTFALFTKVAFCVLGTWDTYNSYWRCYETRYRLQFTLDYGVMYVQFCLLEDSSLVCSRSYSVTLLQLYIRETPKTDSFNTEIQFYLYSLRHRNCVPRCSGVTKNDVSVQNVAVSDPYILNQILATCSRFFIAGSHICTLFQFLHQTCLGWAERKDVLRDPVFPMQIWNACAFRTRFRVCASWKQRLHLSDFCNVCRALKPWNEIQADGSLHMSNFISVPTMT